MRPMMLRLTVRSIFYFFLVAWLWASLTPAVIADGRQAGGKSNPQLQQRIDFGNAQILGQSIKSGAVYLMHRKKSDIRNMLEVRQDYRSEIKEDFDLGETAIVKSDGGAADGNPSSN